MCSCGILKRNIMNRKTALEQLEYWIEQYYRINGTPTLDDIKGQINLLKDYEREQLHIANVVRSFVNVKLKREDVEDMISTYEFLSW